MKKIAIVSLFLVMCLELFARGGSPFAQFMKSKAYFTGRVLISEEEVSVDYSTPVQEQMEQLLGGKSEINWVPNGMIVDRGIVKKKVFLLKPEMGTYHPGGDVGKNILAHLTYDASGPNAKYDATLQAVKEKSLKVANIYELIAYVKGFLSHHPGEYGEVRVPLGEFKQRPVPSERFWGEVRDFFLGTPLSKDPLRDVVYIHIESNGSVHAQVFEQKPAWIIEYSDNCMLYVR